MLKRSIAAMLLIVMVLGCSLANAETEETEQPYLVQITEDDPSIGYVLVQLQNSAGLLPLPQEGEYTKTIRQKMTDGSEMADRVLDGRVQLRRAGLHRRGRGYAGEPVGENIGEYGHMPAAPNGGVSDYERGGRGYR